LLFSTHKYTLETSPSLSRLQFRGYASGVWAILGIVSMLTDVLSFAAVAGLVTIVPGLDTAMVVRWTAAHGRKHGLATALGVNTGILLWGVAAAVGISALLAASAVAYDVVRIGGALYMIGLGARLLLRALRSDLTTPAEPQPWSTPSLLRSWSRGLATNLLNPKIGAFYVAVLPQFIPAHASHLAVGLLLACVHNVEGLAWFAMIIFGVQALRDVLRRRRARQAIDGMTGATLIGFGVKLGLSSR
jgi:threonine/homoserine/homoserine lactone efflux protein